MNKEIFTPEKRVVWYKVYCLPSHPIPSSSRERRHPFLRPKKKNKKLPSHRNKTKKEDRRQQQQQ